MKKRIVCLYVHFSVKYEVSYKYSYIQETRYSMRYSMESDTFLYIFSFKTCFHR